MKAFGMFVGGMLLSSAATMLLCSEDAKKVYVQCTAAALRVKDGVMKTVDTLRESAEGILTEAKAVNAARAAAAEAAAFEDAVIETEEGSTSESDE
ncbi:MAG: DUF6110 family protein [Oscillospiraceae bacterium]|nr:DUF6110 family protein [Oscillospiraceae bacterium]